jgi:hypothetical protein
MPVPVKVVSHAPEDIHVLGGESLIYRIAVGSKDGALPQVSVSSRQGFSRSSYDPLERSVDYSRRVTTDSYGVILAPTPGTVAVSGSIAVPGFGGGSISTSIRVFDEPDVVLPVSSDAELQDAFATINSGSGSHYLISMEANSYSFAGKDALSRSDDYLITFEPDVNSLNSVFITGQPTGGVNYVWRLLHFNAVGSAPAFTTEPASVHVFDTCKFIGGSYGIVSTSASYVRAVGCHTDTCAGGFSGVDVVRSCSGSLLTTAFAYDCSVVDGCIGVFKSGNGDSLIRLSRTFSNTVALTNNTLVDQAGVHLISSDSSTLSSSIITGNVASTSASYCVFIEHLRDSIFAHNTLHTSRLDADALILNSGFSANSFTNNWMYPLTLKAIKGTQFQSYWKQNATSSKISSFPDTLVGLVDQFANNYMFPKRRSPLLSSGNLTMARFSQGAKIKGQIGALPYTSDLDLTFVHRSVIDRPFFNFSGPTPVVY